MGAADIVPGVSGGTVAFITGIYPRLLHSIRSFDLAALRLLLRGELRAAWQHVDASFLTWLLAGIGTSIFTLARVLGWLLNHYPEPLWAFFFGLILASAFMLLRQVPVWNMARVLALLLGTLAALAIALAPRAGFLGGHPGVFLAGFIAICAMILPGISGSFILLLLGMYTAVLTAIRSFDLVFLGVFALGAAGGLLCFSRLLDWLLSRYRGATIAVLTGFLFGSLAAVWPWKQTLSWVAGRDGDPRPAQQWPVLPGDYLAGTGEQPLLLLCVALACTGLFLVLLVDLRWGKLKVEAD
jgi:putative membrane protein